ncbi:MAG TPA: ABC transporter permease/substrate-binding protein [Candidatus Acidoferrales bacterium]|nr:ABC transporter permease/substrate-binding protein [Candidatus Acidoferrales bacterium]
MTVAEFLATHRVELLTLTLEHLFLVAVSTGIAVVIGIPLGVVLTRWPALQKPVMGFANVMQTVPSLALFGFLIPLNVYLFHVRVVGGIGARTAIVALVLYALLPIVRNTFTGIESVDPAIREAGRAMGMTGSQLLFKVELPLALGFILAGVRVATVISVGTATIAAAIDAGGLGRYIFRGLRMNDNTLILAGAVPAALLALAADFGLGRLERFFRASGAARARFRRRAWVALALVALGAVLLGVIGYAAKTTGRLAVGSKDFTEQIILGEIIAQLIEDNIGVAVERRFDLGGNLAHEALVAGEIDLYPEYTGTGLTVILRQKPLTDPRAVYERVKTEYQRLGLVWTEPFGFNNTFAILVRGADARRLGLKTISQVSRYAPKWRAGFGQDFISRPDGFTGFTTRYGLKFKEVREMDLSLTYRALAEGEVDLIAGNSTDGLIARLDLFQLEDDRNYFPPYDAAPVVRADALARFPGLRDVLRRLGGTIAVVEMRELNFKVDGERRPAKEVAREFLQRKGLLLAAR